MKFSTIVSDKELDLGLCVVDIKHNHKTGMVAYSGIEPIIDKLIQRNNFEGEKKSIELEFKDRFNFKIGNTMFEGRWQTYKDPISGRTMENHMLFISHQKTLPRITTRSPIPGLVIKYEMLEDGMYEIYILSTNKIINGFVDRFL